MTPEMPKAPTGIRAFDLQIHQGRRRLQAVQRAVVDATTALGGKRGVPVVLSSPSAP